MAQIALPPEIGHRERPIDAARLTDRLMACRGGCGKKFRVGPGVEMVICGRPCCTLTGIRDRIEREKRGGR